MKKDRQAVLSAAFDTTFNVRFGNRGIGYAGRFVVPAFRIGL